MTPEELVLSDLPVAEVRAIIRTFPADWVRALDYEFVDQNAHQVNQFFSRVIPELPPVEAFAVADDCQEHYLHAMIYLDALDVAARLLADSVKRLLDQLANVLQESWYLAYGPDAGMSHATYRRFAAIAGQLRHTDLAIEPPEQC